MVDYAHGDNFQLDLDQQEVARRPAADLTTVLTYVLDRGNLNMRDYNSLQLVSRSMDAVVCSQFYPHVQSISRLGLTDRMISRALQNSQVFFQRFPVMKDLHVPWNPETIDTTAAITPAQVCQLLTDYPQIESLPPVYLEREGIEGLRGHSVRTATFYPGRCDIPEDDENGQASEDRVGMVSKAEDMLQVQELEVVLVNPKSEGMMFMNRFLNCNLVKQLRCHRSVPIKHFDSFSHLVRNLLMKLLKNAPVTNISRMYLSVVAGYSTSDPVVLNLDSDNIDIVLPSLKSFNLEFFRHREDSIDAIESAVCLDVDVDTELLRCFPNIQELSTPGVGYFWDCVIVTARNDRSLFEKSLRLIASSGVTRLRLHYSDNDVIGLVQEHMVACETIEDVDFGASYSLSNDCVVSFLRVFPQLRKLNLSECPMIGDSLFSAIQNLACLVELDVCDTQCSFGGLREFIRWRYQQIKELNIDMKRLDIRISYHDDNRRQLPAEQFFSKELTEGARVNVDFIHDMNDY